MNVSLTAQLESLLAKKVGSGRFATSSEVVRDGLRLLHRQEKIRILHEEVLKGVADIRAGNRIVLETPEDYAELAEDIKREGRKLLEKRRKG